MWMETALYPSGNFALLPLDRTPLRKHFECGYNLPVFSVLHFRHCKNGLSCTYYPYDSYNRCFNYNFNQIFATYLSLLIIASEKEVTAIKEEDKDEAQQHRN